MCNPFIINGSTVCQGHTVDLGIGQCQSVLFGHMGHILFRYQKRVNLQMLYMHVMRILSQCNAYSIGIKWLLKWKGWIL